MTKWIAGLLLAVATMAAMYAVASTTATALAGSFSAEERTRPTRDIEREVAVKRGTRNLRQL
jgi:hypothetical protein